MRLIVSGVLAALLLAACGSDVSAPPTAERLDGRWTGSTQGVSISLDLRWTSDSVVGAGTWTAAADNTLGCGGGTLSGTGTLRLAAARTGQEMIGPTTFSNGWSPPFVGVLGDSTTLDAHFMSVDRGPCPITLVRR